MRTCLREARPWGLVAQIVFRFAVAGPTDGRRAVRYCTELCRRTASPTDNALQRSVMVLTGGAAEASQAKAGLSRADVVTESGEASAYT